jgi:PTS system ascorbate-specific IIA component
MIARWLPPKHMTIVQEISNWQDAVVLSAAPLLAEQAISKNYVDAIIRSHLDIGPYYVLAPGLAMPHARPEQGVYKTGLSLLYVKNGVSFNSEENDPVYVIICLCALTGDEHLALISQLAELFSDEESLDLLLKADTKEKIYRLISRY